MFMSYAYTNLFVFVGFHYKGGDDVILIVDVIADGDDGRLSDGRQ